MTDEKTSKVKSACDDVKLRIANKLPEIADACISKAIGDKKTSTDPSVPHAKFLLELLLLQPVAAEKKTKAADEKPEESQETEEPSLSRVLLDTLKELMVENGMEAKAAALP